MNTNSSLKKGILLMTMSAFLTSEGQLVWKLAVEQRSLAYILGGFLLYGIGALTMIISFKFGELSILYPIMCISYAFAILNGYIFLGETINIVKFIGITLIIIGVIFIGRGQENDI